VTDLAITAIRFTPALEAQARTGLLGWVQCVVAGDLKVSGIAVRRTAEGCVTLSFPERTDASGRRHPVVHPISDAARRAVERQIFGALGVGEDAA